MPQLESGTVTERPELSPEQLARKCQAGCRDSFNLLVAQFEGRLFHFLCRLVANPHDAEDLTQDTFLKAYQNIHRYNSAYAFSTWLFTIAKRTAANFYRDSRPSEPLTSEELSHEADPAAVLAQKDEGRNVWEIAKGLKSNQYQALWLRYGEGLSIEETARIMRVNQIHVRVLLHRGRSHLAKILRRSRLEKGHKPLDITMP